ncbi:hypothetical protein [Paucisalibacillus globulus]|uniref:hypothetical protein n=1 Tax=Paucisalibacillus globulus TaxID=351095 RepID=UPI000A04E8C7|nr:hypothetical protein [Paucisalibacillus globulus]
MINEFLYQQKVEYIGAFIAPYADAITANINPSNLHKSDIAFIIKDDETIRATKVPQQDSNQRNINWIEITNDNIMKRTSLKMRKACFSK